MNKTAYTSPCTTDTVLALYLKEINTIPLLSVEEEHHYAVEAAKGNKKAQEKLVEANLRFVVSIAKKYQNKNIPIMDLISEGNIGLIHAAERFDPNRGYKFISYAVWWIRQAILKAICEKSRMIRLPLNRANELVQIEKLRKTLEKTQDLETDVTAIAQQLHIEPEMVQTIVNTARPPLSLDVPVFTDNNGGTAGDYIQDMQYGLPEDQVMDQYLRAHIDSLLDSLTEREAEIIRYRFGLNGYEQLSLKAVGLRFGLTKERIRQIEKKALEQLYVLSRSEELEAFVA
ncbi:MAG: sigma-70 family RNA polymerase sigma factor [Treponema sp.]